MFPKSSSQLCIYFKKSMRESLWSLFYACVPGSSPGGSRVIQRGDRIGVLGKNLFNYRYRLETDSVVGNISGEKEAE